MIGVYDSGMGGEFALAYLKRLLPREKFYLYTDRENAPYGTKGEGELIKIVSSSLTRILSVCDGVLIACCTASTVHPKLPRDLRERSLPIIRPTAERAKSLTASGKIALIATDATVRSHAFAIALSGVEVAEMSAQPLVLAVEGTGGHPKEEAIAYLEEKIKYAADWGADVLILGCTHFSAYEEYARDIIKRKIKKRISVVNSARVGAIAARERFFPD